jgi:signal transduction histidine kinase
MMRSLSEDKNIDLVVVVDPAAPPIYQDQSKVQQILTNLLSNAIEFTPEGGRITVRTEHSIDDLLVLTVSDTGVGIPEEDRDVIFEKFRQSKAGIRGDALTREYSGTGLGLSIVKELCKLLGGEISFTSELGKGSTFTVTLPWSLPNRSRAAAHPSKGNEFSIVEARVRAAADAVLARAGEAAKE